MKIIQMNNIYIYICFYIYGPADLKSGRLQGHRFFTDLNQTGTQIFHRFPTDSSCLDHRFFTDFPQISYGVN